MKKAKKFTIKEKPKKKESLDEALARIDKFHRK